MTYTVLVEGISKAFAGRSVVRDLSFGVEPGTVCALLGPNGAGKTTLVRILSTLIRPDSGTAFIAGHDLLHDPVGVRRSISLTGQFAAVDDRLTAAENLEMMGRLSRLSKRDAAARAGDLLTEFSMEDAADRRVATFSGGMKRRLDLAISMISRPPVLFLDEPTTGLDPRSREQLWGSVRSLVETGITILLTTQYLEEADQLADSVVVLHKGVVVARGTTDDLKSSFGSETIRLHFADEVGYTRAAAMLTGARAVATMRIVEVGTDGSAAAVHRLLDRLASAGCAADRIAIERPSLDDVFMALTEETA